MAKIISIVCHKGGVGKTTTAVSVGGILASKFNQRVLLVDLDAQKNLTETFVTLDGTERDAFELFSVLETRRVQAPPVISVRENLDIIPSSDRMCTLDMVYGGRTGRELAVRKSLRGVRDRYDWIIIDSPAQIGMATTNAITAADYVVIPISCDAYSMGGLNQIMDLIDGIREDLNENLQVAGVLKTKFQSRRIVDTAVDDQFAQELGDLVFRTAIRECEALKQAPFAKSDIYTFDRGCNGSADYVAFARELAERVGVRMEG